MTSPEPRSLAIPVGDRGTVTALVYDATAAASRDGSTFDRPVVALAHGAGAGQRNAFMVQIARALAGRGARAVTFNFPYTEAGRSVPDRQPVLEATWRAVVRYLVAEGEAPAGRLVIGGKSMGGRMASHVLTGEADQTAHRSERSRVTAAGAEASIAPLVGGLVLLGYPLHPPGDRARLRVEHLPRLHTATLVVQGSRDEFGTADEVREAFAVVPARVDWLVIDGGNHSFKVPRGASRSNPQVLEDVADAVAAFVRSAAGSTKRERDR